jgi:competence protein ComEA
MNRGRFLLAFTLGGGLFVYAAVSAMTATASAQQAVAPPTPVPGHSDTSAHPEMPDGPGKTLLLRTCSKCHQVDTIARQHKDNDAWTATIIKMVGLGSVATDDEYETILTYLTANYGSLPPGVHAKIEVNKETATELASQFGVSDKDAAAIVTYRAKNGPFKSIDDLKKVPGIDTKKIDDKKDDLSFS